MRTVLNSTVFYAFDIVMVYRPSVVPKSVLNCPRHLFHHPQADGTLLFRALEMGHCLQCSFSKRPFVSPLALVGQLWASPLLMSVCLSVCVLQVKWDPWWPPP